MRDDWLTLFVVYNRSKEFPEHYMVRCHHVRPDAKITIDPEPLIVTQTLEEIRRQLTLRGLSCLGHSSQCDQVIVETWF